MVAVTLMAEHTAGVSDADAEQQFPIPADWAGEPRLVVFCIPSPVPLGLPHNKVYTFHRQEPVAWLSGAPMAVRPGSPPVAEWEGGSNFVSVQIWRPRSSLRLPVEPMLNAMRVTNALLELPLDQRPEPPDAPVFETGATVFEAVTPLLTGADGTINGAVNEALDRCLEELSIFSAPT